MKKLLLLSSLISITSLSATSWFGGWFAQKETIITVGDKEITPSEKIITQRFTLNSIPTKISARAHAQVTIRSIDTGATPYVELRTHENLLEYVAPQEDNGALQIGFHNVDTYSIYSGTIVMKYTIYMPLTNTLKKLQASNHAKITVEDKIDTTDLSISNHNHGKITVSIVVANNLNITTTNHAQTVAHVNANVLTVETTNHASTTVTGTARSKNITLTRKANNDIRVLMSK